MRRRTNEINPHPRADDLRECVVHYENACTCTCSLYSSCAARTLWFQKSHTTCQASSCAVRLQSSPPPLLATVPTTCCTVRYCQAFPTFAAHVYGCSLHTRSSLFMMANVIWHYRRRRSTGTAPRVARASQGAFLCHATHRAHRHALHMRVVPAPLSHTTDLGVFLPSNQLPSLHAI